MMGQTLRHGGLLKDIGGWGGGEKGKRTDRLENFDQIIRDMGCESFREVKELTWHGTEPCGNVGFYQTSLRTVYSIMMMIRKC